MGNEALLSGSWRIPVFTLTGFLGSGKTSLLVRLLRQPTLARTALVVNEFGDVGIDQLTLRQVDENVRLLEHGCLCCTTRDDLLETLRGLYIDRLGGVAPPFERVIIETSGMADPIPVIHTLMVDPLLQERYAYRGTLVTVDLTQPLETLVTRAEGARQIAAADAFVLTKHDLPSAQPASELADRLRRINPDAPVRVNDDEAVVDMAAAIAGERLDASGPERAPAAWMIDALARSRGLGPADATGVAGAMGRVHTSSPVETFVVRVDGPTPVASVSAWLEDLVLRNASRLLRLKGVVSVTEQPDPIVVHAVRNLFHPSTSVPRHANDPGGTRLVVIVDNAERRDRRSLGREVLGPALFEACERGQVVTIPMSDAFPA